MLVLLYAAVALGPIVMVVVILVKLFGAWMSKVTESRLRTQNVAIFDWVRSQIFNHTWFRNSTDTRMAGFFN